METQGTRIKKIRQALNLSQDDFGKIFDISKQFVSLLEKDKTFLNNEKLVKLLVDYDVNINYLLAGKGQMFYAQQFEKVQDELTQRVREILKQEGVIKWLTLLICEIVLLLFYFRMIRLKHVKFVQVLFLS